MFPLERKGAYVLEASECGREPLQLTVVEADRDDFLRTKVGFEDAVHVVGPRGNERHVTIGRHPINERARNPAAQHSGKRWARDCCVIDDARRMKRQRLIRVSVGPERGP